MSEIDDAIAFYKRNQDGFLSDFWHGGNRDLSIAITPRNVESGCWFEATWKAKSGESRSSSAQTMRLMWERVMRQYLEDESK